MKLKTMISAMTAVFVLAACHQETTNTQSESVSKVADNKGVTYRIGVEPMYPPFIQRVGNGEMEGFDVDLLAEIAKREGFNVQYEPRLWAGIFDLLDRNELDIIMGGAVATDERRQKWALSEPYHQVTTVLIAPEKSTIQKYTDGRGKKIAYSPGGSAKTELEKLQGTTNLDTNMSFSTSWLRVKSVMDQTSDAAIGISASFEYYADKYPDQKLRVIYPDNPEFSDVVFAVRKNDTELLAKLNRGLASVKQDGTLDKLKSKWFTTKR